MKDLNKTIFVENFILDILQGPKYAPEMNFTTDFWASFKDWFQSNSLALKTDLLFLLLLLYLLKYDYFYDYFYQENSRKNSMMTKLKGSQPYGKTRNSRAAVLH